MWLGVSYSSVAAWMYVIMEVGAGSPSCGACACVLCFAWRPLSADRIPPGVVFNYRGFCPSVGAVAVNWCSSVLVWVCVEFHIWAETIVWYLQVWWVLDWLVSVGCPLDCVCCDYGGTHYFTILILITNITIYYHICAECDSCGSALIVWRWSGFFSRGACVCWCT